MEPNSRKKILLLSDDFRSPSGVGTMSAEIILGTAHKYNWVQIGAAINHPEAGKIVNMSEYVNEMTGLTDANVKIIPSNGYGDITFLRQVMKMEKPDAIFIFTDPRYWTWLFDAEREIRSQVPILYLNIWDDLPYPLYNKPYYLSCAGLFAISKQTYNINKQVLGKEADEKVLRYIPHGVSKLYYPIENPEEDPKFKEFRDNMRGGKEFVLLYNARNIGRKRPGDMILAWQEFCKQIGPEEAKKCRFVLHTDPVDNAGTDLPAIIRDLCDQSFVDIKLFPAKLSTEEMNYLYNSSDGVILISSNEGWGLSLTESLITGKMFISTVTGGMQDQMRFEDENGNWINFSKTFPSNHTGTYRSHGEWAIPIFPSNRSLCGAVPTPYIYDDRASIEDIAKAIRTLYELGPEERQRRGMKGHDWAVSDEAGFTAKQMCSRIIEAIDSSLKNFKEHPRSRYEVIKVEKRPVERIDYDPINYTV